MIATDEGEPKCYKKAIYHMNTRKDKMKSPYENHILDLVKLSKGERALKNK